MLAPEQSVGVGNLLVLHLKGKLTVDIYLKVYILDAECNSVPLAVYNRHFNGITDEIALLVASLGSIGAG